MKYCATSNTVWKETFFKILSFFPRNSQCCFSNWWIFLLFIHTKSRKSHIPRIESIVCMRLKSTIATPKKKALWETFGDKTKKINHTYLIVFFFFAAYYQPSKAFSFFLANISDFQIHKYILRQCYVQRYLAGEKAMREKKIFFFNPPKVIFLTAWNSGEDCKSRITLWINNSGCREDFQGFHIRRILAGHMNPTGRLRGW